LVEHATENCGVASSILALGTQAPPSGVFAFYRGISDRIVSTMSKKIIIIPVAIFLIIGILGVLLLIPRQVTIQVNGIDQTVTVHALTVGGAVRQAGFQPADKYQIDPPRSKWLKPGLVIQVDQARMVTIHINPAGDDIEFKTATRKLSDILAEAGLEIEPNDRITFNGQPVDLDQELKYNPQLLLEVHRAVAVTVNEKDHTQTIYSSASTLGQALWEVGITLTIADRVSPPLDTPLQQPLTVQIEQARPVTIQVDGKEVTTPTAAVSVADALGEADISLQGLDYSLPSEQEPIPSDRLIKVVRVREEVLLNQQAIPYNSTYQPDPNTEMDKRSVVSPGEFGLQVSRERVLYEDGVEVSREEDAQWVAKQPSDQVLGYGTKPVVNTIDTPNGTLEYWRAVNVWATSYSPCRLGIPNYCNSTTASGLTVRQGIVAVTRAWYSWMVGQKVYIPGYGVAVIADVGGGIPGRYWVDLGYSDADYVTWSQSVTMYFLTPIPQNIPWILP
jgi:uncharacterized protein YabE (DUF348 family)